MKKLTGYLFVFLVGIAPVTVATVLTLNPNILNPQPLPQVQSATVITRTPPPKVNATQSPTKVNTTVTTPDDGLIECNISPKCGGGTKRMSTKQCEDSICCELESGWSMVDSLSTCGERQKAWLDEKYKYVPPEPYEPYIHDYTTPEPVAREVYCTYEQVLPDNFCENRVHFSEPEYVTKILECRETMWNWTCPSGMTPSTSNKDDLSCTCN